MTHAESSLTNYSFYYGEEDGEERFRIECEKCGNLLTITESNGKGFIGTVLGVSPCKNCNRENNNLTSREKLAGTNLKWGNMGDILGDE